VEHKATRRTEEEAMDEEYRGKVYDVKRGLAFYFSNQARWRWEKADEHPEDERKRRSAAGLDELAMRVLRVADEGPIFEDLVSILADSEFDYLNEMFLLGEETDRITSRFHFDDPTEDYYSFLDRFLMALKTDHKELLETA